MRVLCLRLESQKDLIESFLRFTPHIYWRSDDFLFLDISSTAHLFGGVVNIFERVQQFAHQRGLSTQIGAGDTPARAQLNQFLGLPEGELMLDSLPIEYLKHCEGLRPWKKPSEIEGILDFLKSVGVETVKDFKKITQQQLKNLWKDTGSQLYRKFHKQDGEVIPILLPEEKFYEYQYYDFPIYKINFVLTSLENLLKKTIIRAQRKRILFKEIRINFYLEYSGLKKDLALSFAKPTKDLCFVIKSLEKKLEKTDLQNPIREMELHLSTQIDVDHQLSLFNRSQVKMDQIDDIRCLLKQSGIECGFFCTKASIIPEESFSIGDRAYLAQEGEDIYVLESELLPELRVAPKSRRVIHLDNHKLNNSIFSSNKSLSESVLFRPVYSKLIDRALRPSLFYKRLVPINNIQDFRFTMDFPIERFSSQWWQKSSVGRDYFCVQSNRGEFLWIFREHRSGNFFIHGCFD